MHPFGDFGREADVFVFVEKPIRRVRVPDTEIEHPRALDAVNGRFLRHGGCGRFPGSDDARDKQGAQSDCTHSKHPSPGRPEVPILLLRCHCSPSCELLL